MSDQDKLANDPIPEEAQEQNPGQDPGGEALDPSAALEAERDELKDRMLRLAAETENFKKRTQREQAQFLKRANESLVKDLLPILDNLERAQEAAVADGVTDQGLLDGLNLIQQDLRKVLTRHGLEEIEALGEPFDPERHEAMMQQEDAGADENTVIQQLQKGYLFQDRLLRPAMVVVSKRPAGEDSEGEPIDITVH